MSIIELFIEPRESDQHLKFQAEVMIKLWGGVVAMGEGEEPEARGAVTSYPSKASICPILGTKLVAELQMMLHSGRRTPNDIGSPYFPYNPTRLPAEQDCEFTISISLFLTVNFKTSLPELPYK